MVILALCFLLTLGQVPVDCQNADFIKELAARIAALEKTDQIQKTEIENQRESLQQLQKENDKHNVELSLQEQRIEELEETVQVQQRIIKDCAILDQSDRENNGVSNAAKTHDVQSVGEKERIPSKNSSRVSGLKDIGKHLNVPVRNARLVTQTPETVAFHATVDVTNHVTKLTIGQTIVFDSVHMNVGGGYHKSAGLFLAPTAGVYMFSVSVMLNAGTGWISLDLVQNGSVLAEAYAYGYDQGSVSVVTQLNLGDEVLVKVHGPNDSMFYGEKLTSFMGVLLVPM